MVPIKERFEKKILKGAYSTCWLWVGAKHDFGYGKLFCGKVGSPALYAHRFSYETYKGPIAEGLCVCHRCDNPGCVNPDHLFLGTQSQNIKDCVAKGRNVPPSLSVRNKAKTHCDHGHEFTPENTYMAKGHRRKCRTCLRAGYNRYHAKQRAAAAQP